MAQESTKLIGKIHLMMILMDLRQLRSESKLAQLMNPTKAIFGLNMDFQTKTTASVRLMMSCSFVILSRTILKNIKNHSCLKYSATTCFANELEIISISVNSFPSEFAVALSAISPDFASVKTTSKLAVG